MNTSMLIVLLSLLPTHAGHDGPDEKAEVVIEVRGDYRYVTSNGLPDHSPGRFPNRNNPNTISEQDYHFRMPVDPQPLDQPREAHGQLFGVAINGVVFDPGTAETWKGDRDWRYEALSGKINLGFDAHHAHVQPSGAYHYHGLPTGLINKRGGIKQMLLVGYAADGFPIYGPYAFTDAQDAESKLNKLTSSYQIKKGKRPSGPGGTYDGTFVQDYEYVEGLGDLDECNGRFGVTPEYPDGTYYYVLTDKYPFIPRMFQGEPDDSFRKRGPGPGSGEHHRRGGENGPPERRDRRRPPPRERRP